MFTNNWLLIFLLPSFFSCLDSAETILHSLSLEQKIAQLFIIGVDNSEYLTQEDGVRDDSFFSNERSRKYNKALAEKLIKEYGIGGVHFIGYGTLASSLQGISELQAISTIPLLISQDFEWGLKMRLSDAIKFPYAMTLGAIADNALLYKLGREMARQCKALGVHINFAPVVDINSNVRNPVINYRSFGSDKYTVTDKAIALMQGMQDHGVIACAKHFCGHGDSAVDSHLDLPTLTHTIDRLMELELYPFKRLIDAGVQSIMTAHLHVPVIDDRAHRSITLSKKAITDFLQNELGFSGLIITDALNMQAISNFFNPGEVELEAFLAGNDILLMPEDVPLAITTVRDAIIRGDIDENELNRRVLKILTAKESLGLFNKEEQILPLIEIINNAEAIQLKKQLYEASITLVKNEGHFVPVDYSEDTLALVQIGGTKESIFSQQVKNNYQANLKYFFIESKADSEQWNQLAGELKQCKKIIIALFDITRFIQSNYGISDVTRSFIYSLHIQQKDMLVTLFGNAYSLRLFNSLPNLMMAYEAEDEAQIAAAQIILGQLPALGKLPITYDAEQ